MPPLSTSGGYSIDAFGLQEKKALHGALYATTTLE
jgi:hypothetical protein